MRSLLLDYNHFHICPVGACWFPPSFLRAGRWPRNPQGTMLPFFIRGFPVATRLSFDRLFKAQQPSGSTNAPDLFANTRMPFGDHLEELRSRLWRSVAGFGVALVLVFILDFA